MASAPLGVAAFALAFAQCKSEPEISLVTASGDAGAEHFCSHVDATFCEDFDTTYPPWSRTYESLGLPDGSPWPSGWDPCGLNRHLGDAGIDDLASTSPPSSFWTNLSANEVAPGTTDILETQMTCRASFRSSAGDLTLDFDVRIGTADTLAAIARLGTRVPNSTREYRIDLVSGTEAADGGRIDRIFDSPPSPIPGTPLGGFPLSAPVPRNSWAHVSMSVTRRGDTWRAAVSLNGETVVDTPVLWLAGAPFFELGLRFYASGNINAFGARSQGAWSTRYDNVVLRTGPATP